MSSLLSMLYEVHDELRSRAPPNVEVCLCSTHARTFVRVDVFSVPMHNVAALTLTVACDHDDELEARLLCFDDTVVHAFTAPSVAELLQDELVQELLSGELHLCQGIRDERIMDSMVHRRSVDSDKWLVESDLNCRRGVRLRSRECERRVKGELRVCWQCASSSKNLGEEDNKLNCADIKTEDGDDEIQDNRERGSNLMTPVHTLDDDDDNQDDGTLDEDDDDLKMDVLDDEDDKTGVLDESTELSVPKRRRRRKGDKMNHDPNDPFPKHCVICFRKFKRRVLYDKHMITHRVRIPNLDHPISCPLCHQQSSSIMELNPHLQTAHGNGMLWCIECSELVPEKQFAVHFKNRHELAVKRHLCSVCGEKFRTPRDLQVHMTMKHDPKPSMLVCEECGRPFRHRVKLNIHVRTTHRKIELPCNECGKTFNRIGKLQKHVLIHAQSKPYGCAHCSYRSVRRDMVRLHVRRTHHKEAVMEDIVVDETAAAAVESAVTNALVGARSKPKQNESQNSTPT